MATTPAQIPRRRRVRKSLRPVLDVKQDPNYIPGKLPALPGLARPGRKPRTALLYQYRIKATDMYVSVIMNPRHPTIRSVTAGGPARSLAPLLDAGYTFGPLLRIRPQERQAWALDRMPEGVELFGYRKIESTPTT